MKGIISKPMPKHWHDAKAAATSGDPIDVKICADKKPYFMTYRYPELRSQYLTFKSVADRKAKLLFGSGLDALLSKEDASSEENTYLEYYHRFTPVQISHGVINRICNVCETYFEDLREAPARSGFDPALLKTGVDYSRATKDAIKHLYLDYMARLQEVAAATDDELSAAKLMLLDDFRQECSLVCPSEIELCDIVVDICYSKEKSKQFAWDMCGAQMVTNIVRNTGGGIYWPKPTARGDIVYGGKRFKLEYLQLSEVNEDEGYYFE